MDPTLATLLIISVTVIAVLLVLILIILIPVLLQVRRTAHETGKLIVSLRLQVAPVSCDIIAISQEVKTVIQSIHRQVDWVEYGIETVRDMVVRVKEFHLERTGPLRSWVSTRVP